MSYSNSSFIPSVIPPENAGTPLWFAFQGDRLLVQRQETGFIVPHLPDLTLLNLAPIRQHYLGQLGNTPCFVADLPPNSSLSDGYSYQGLRRLFSQLEESLFHIAVRAVQIVAWDRNHQFCGRCATPTISKTNEHAKDCPQCGLVFYPRLSPAMIVAITRDKQLLLAHAHRQPPGFYSVLAGFVEPGETLEESVLREVQEEVGILVKNIRYFGSQPWPFPDSLMIAFTAEYAAGELQPDPTEIADVGWYAAEQLPALIPSPISIARALIDHFVVSTSLTD